MENNSKIFYQYQELIINCKKSIFFHNFHKINMLIINYNIYSILENKICDYNDLKYLINEIKHK